MNVERTTCQGVRKASRVGLTRSGTTVTVISMVASRSTAMLASAASFPAAVRMAPATTVPASVPNRLDRP